MDAEGFGWDDDKADKNFRKHGVTFGEAATVFDDPLSATIGDDDHSDDEDRFITVGLSAQGRVVIVSHTDRDGNIRIISARAASAAERKGYSNGTFP